MAPDSNSVKGLPPGPSGSMIDGNFVVRVDREIFRFELIPLADIDRVHFVRQTDLFQHDRNFFSVRCAPGIELNHPLSPFGSSL